MLVGKVIKDYCAESVNKRLTKGITIYFLGQTEIGKTYNLLGPN